MAGDTQSSISVSSRKRNLIYDTTSPSKVVKNTQSPLEHSQQELAGTKSNLPNTDSTGNDSPARIPWKLIIKDPRSLPKAKFDNCPELPTVLVKEESESSDSGSDNDMDQSNDNNRDSGLV